MYSKNESVLDFKKKKKKKKHTKKNTKRQEIKNLKKHFSKSRNRSACFTVREQPVYTTYMITKVYILTC